jgi:tetratricopeptide (TPR) repeat protein
MAAVLSGFCLLCAAIYVIRGGWSIERLLRDGRRALARGDVAAAVDMAHRAVDRAGNSVGAWRLLAESAELAEDAPQTLAAWKRLVDLDAPRAAHYWMCIGRCQMREMRIGLADEALQRALAIDDCEEGALRLRAQLMQAIGRSQEATNCLMRLIRCSSMQPGDLLRLASIETLPEDLALIDSMLRNAANEPPTQLARARRALDEDRPAEAEQHLANLIALEPHWWEAQALLGTIYSGRTREEFLRWQAGLPPEADADARIWLTRGMWLRQQGELRQASRCFWEALQREPDLLPATMQLGQTLSLAGQRPLGKQFLQRGELMKKISRLAAKVVAQQDLRLATPLVADLEAVGRLCEAWAWCSLQAQSEAGNMQPRDEALATRLGRLSARLSHDLPRAQAGSLPGQRLDWSSVPLPDWSSYQPDQSSKDLSAATKINFVDEARSLGLAFEYVNNTDPVIRGHRIFETTGGGVAVIDFDGDGWPDLYFAQGGTVSVVSGPDVSVSGASGTVVSGNAPLDALFRNQGGLRFDDVTEPSRIVEDSFSQGVAAGDIDNDGFPDLYVANIGRNRLLHNNGDGTFADVTESAGLNEQAWTVSCAIADLNGDGFPDLFDVNYLEGDEIFTTICVDDKGEPRVCRPTVFKPALDCVALNHGDGRFVEMQEEAGLNLPHGPGLGLVVADFNSDGRLDVFVANDMAPNHLLLNTSTSEPPAQAQHATVAQEPGNSQPVAPLKFVEQALLLGVGLDSDGFARAGMGVASGDVNDDGRLDLFVTTFAQEADVLYLSQPDGSYVDGTRAAGLRAATFELLGFGTQFLDADLDGRLDLIILNGHIDDLSGNGQNYRMRPQFFRGLPGPRFVELTELEVGAFFGERRLGRGLATLDWNRDGLPDFVATYLEGNVALATNKTLSAGHSLRLKLVGTSSSRDAIGAKLRIVPISGWDVHVQVTAGDGYESSSERLVQVGTGSREEVERLEITWASGNISVFEHIDCRQTWLAIEGSPRLTPLNRQ